MCEHVPSCSVMYCLFVGSFLVYVFVTPCAAAFLTSTVTLSMCVYVCIVHGTSASSPFLCLYSLVACCSRFSYQFVVIVCAQLMAETRQDTHTHTHTVSKLYVNRYVHEYISMYADSLLVQNFVCTYYVFNSISISQIHMHCAKLAALRMYVHMYVQQIYRYTRYIR